MEKTMNFLTYLASKDTYVKDIIKNNFGISERLLRKLKINGRILCNGKPIWVNDVIHEGDKLEINISFNEESEQIKAENIPIEVLYEDTSILVLNKPSGVVVHPTCLHQEATMANAIKYYLESKNEHVKTRFANRLDKDTSGVIIFAKNEYSQESLSRQMQRKIFKKEYLAVVDGIVEEQEGRITLPIKRAKNSIMLRETAPDGETAVTNYKVKKHINEEPERTILKISIETGRTHQIRVHMRAIGHPILGDGLYGQESEIISRQALHAYKVEFIHPVSREKIKITAKIPKDIKEICRSIAR